MLYIFITWLILILTLIILAQGIQKNSEDGGESVYKRWGGWLIGLFVVGSVPLGYALYTELRGGYIGANIGLGLALFFTWGLCALLLCVALIIWVRYWYKRNRVE
ncbi:hypothetical protein B2I21_24000 [Chryseobacterium mucoviscidosis]|nr:hypothetical protein B2I21_24000 [Chryseobacterium mucoviscidosis]